MTLLRRRNDQNRMLVFRRDRDRLSRVSLADRDHHPLTLHYHATPITPISALYELAGRCFCVSFAYPQDIKRAHAIGQSVMLDNGAFSQWQLGLPTDWPAYYRWLEQWLTYPTTWAVIPDCIDAGADMQDMLLRQWPFATRGAPVWHMDEPIERLLDLCDYWPKVCIGSTSKFVDVLSDIWCARMDEAWNHIASRHRFLPWIHMLRGMACVGGRWPFASVDSSDIGRNHNRLQNTPRKLADRWDRVQCPGLWRIDNSEQLDLIESR
jgi:hypothetical protein